MAINLDKCFSAFPKIIIGDDHHAFWQETYKKVKASRFKLKTRLRLGQSFGRETRYEISYPSFTGEDQKGYLSLPGKFGRYPLVIHVHDYMETEPVYFPGLYQEGFAQMGLWLRGHHKPFTVPSAQGPIPPPPSWTPGYFRANLEKREDFFLRQVYTDLLVALETAQKNENIDALKIIIYGRGIGAAAAAYAAWLNPAVKGVYLENPSFTSLDVSLNKSKINIAREIHESITIKNKAKVKKTLSSFDTLNISEEILCPVSLAVGFLDEISPPEAVFGFFNHLRCPKQVMVYPAENHRIMDAALSDHLAAFARSVFAGQGIPDIDNG